MTKRSYFVALLLLCLGAVPVFWGSRTAYKAYAQSLDEKQKQIVRTGERNEPLRVISVTSDQKNVDFGKKFSTSGDWLNDFSILYRNSTNKKIVSISLRFVFPETIESGNVMAYSASFGTPRKSALRGQRTVVFNPGEDIPLTLTQEDARKMKIFLSQRHPLSSLTKVDLRISFILFDDGTAWDGGYVIQDPNNPKRWIDAPPSEGGKQ